ncbi:MAG: hypothetical protein ACOC5T_04345 [Elusimicrobiota bacterium]
MGKMDRGRKIGQREVTVEEINLIVELTLSSTYSRRQIAEKVNRSKDTVWRYQKNYGLI